MGQPDLTQSPHKGNVRIDQGHANPDSTTAVSRAGEQRSFHFEGHLIHRSRLGNRFGSSVSKQFRPVGVSGAVPVLQKTQIRPDVSQTLGVEAMNNVKTHLVVLIFCSVIGTFAPQQSSGQASAQASLAGKQAGQVRQDNGLAMKFVWCPPGRLTMEQIEVVEEPAAPGSDAKQKPRRVEKRIPVKVSLSQGYWLGQYEVTQAEWQRLMETTPWIDCPRFVPDQGDIPAVTINWIDAMEFCGKLSRQERAAGRLPEGWEYILPTEAQWEYACRAQTETEFYFGDHDSKIGECAWFFDNTSGVEKRYAQRVGQKRPNAWGLFDMHGNAAELCRDYYHPKLPGGTDPLAAGEGWNRVCRGGCWNDGANACRSGYREGFSPIPRGNCIGFRVAICPGDADNTAASLHKLKAKVPVLSQTEHSGPAMQADARKAGAFPGDAPDVVASMIKIMKLGGRVRRDFGRGDCPITGVELGFSNRLSDADLVLLGPLKTVSSIDVGFTSVSDGCLEQMARVTELRSLFLGGTKITDAGLQTLQRISNLHEVYLDGTAIGDDGLKHLAELRSLKALSLGDTQITDSGLQQLAKLEMLTDLDLTGTQITKAAADKLQAALPKLVMTPPKPVVIEPTAVSPLVGTTAENWSTTDLAGKTHSLEAYRGKVVILDFWFRQCTYCLRAMPQVNQIARHFENQSVVVFGASTDEKEEDACAVVDKMGIKYPVLKATELKEKYQIEGFPTLLIIDQHGIIRHVHNGYSPTLREDVVKIVEGLFKSE